MQAWRQVTRVDLRRGRGVASQRRRRASSDQITGEKRCHQGAHAGDMPNLTVGADGTGTFEFVLKDVTLGTGTIVVGLAAVIVGEAIFGARSIAVSPEVVITVSRHRIGCPSEMPLAAVARQRTACVPTTASARWGAGTTANASPSARRFARAARDARLGASACHARAV